MRLQGRIRAIHRWAYDLPLPLLGMQLLTGLYLFALPYVTGQRDTGQSQVAE